ncbi:MAG: VPLPA-CTERM sorting domain-containing protein [Gammaproteobacteria bacterium]|nr:VPLPA-CTERM sorting domain-containing protein [Gammaproteobacteria bacterium]MBQ0840700.1 VPLPA-CTERM sorting domain-containing protein [Gammaproteobacteria bacterium]
MLGIYDASTATSHIFDTGMGFNAALGFANGTVANIDLTGVNLAQSQWALFAGDSVTNNRAPTLEEAGQRILSTSTVDQLSYDGTNTTIRTRYTSSIISMDYRIQAHNTVNANGANLDNAHTATTTPGDASLGGWVTNPYNQNPSFFIDGIMAGIGSDLSLFLVSEVFIDGGRGGVINDLKDELLGALNLSTTGELSFISASVDPVPLPAAAWLMISGLAGLAGVSRRRSAEASAS